MTRHGGRNQALNNLATGRTIKFELKCHTHAFAYDLPGSDADASSDASPAMPRPVAGYPVVVVVVVAQCTMRGERQISSSNCTLSVPLPPLPLPRRCAKFTV